MKPIVAALIGLFTIGFAVGQGYEPPPLQSVPTPEESGAYLYRPEEDHWHQLLPWPITAPGSSSTSRIEQREMMGGAVLVLHTRGEGAVGLERMLGELSVEEYEIVRLDAPQQIWVGENEMRSVQHRDQSSPRDVRPLLRSDLAPDADTWVFDIRAARVNLRLSGESYDEVEDVQVTQMVTIPSEALAWEREMAARAERASAEVE